MKNFTYNYATLCLSLLCQIMFLACDKKEQEINIPTGEKISIKVRVKNTLYDTGDDLITKKSNSITNSLSENKNEAYLDFNEDFYIRAQLTEENIDLSPKLSSVTNRATKDTTIISQNIKYKVLVFDSNEEYITERDYITGQENSFSDFLLDGNKLYTFIVYSINSTTSNPEVNFNDNNNKTLQTATSNINGQDDFMYFRKDMYITGNADNYLDVIFKHKLSQITTVIDASQTEYNITNVIASFDTHNDSAIVDLSNGEVARNGSVGNVSILFPTSSLNNSIVTSTPTIVNASTNASTSLNINNITIGSLSQNNINLLSDLSVTPGVKYKLTLTLIPQDEYVVINGFSSAKIGGQTWMRHNVGSDYSIDPDVIPFATGLHGNYYQFGRINVVALPTANSTNSSWVQNNAGAAFWNTGTESAPIKTTADPCPSGFRIPTRTEVQQLLTNVNATNIGTFTNGTSQFSSAKLLTSKRKKSITLTLPAQGFFNVSGSMMSNYAPTAINNRGSAGNYYTSSASGTNIWAYTFSSSSISVNNLTGNASYRSQSRNIRCIAQ